MFIPKYFKVTDMDEVKEFIQTNSFGTLVTTKQGKPIATHIPLEYRKKAMNIILPDIWHTGILSGEHSKHVRPHL